MSSSSSSSQYIILDYGKRLVNISKFYGGCLKSMYKQAEILNRLEQKSIL